MSMKLTFEILLQSDYHVGAGHSQGTETDSALLRDADGIPVFRGTAITGLLRDALWRLLQLGPLQDRRRCTASGDVEATETYCGQYTVGDEAALCPVCRVFGTPRSMKGWRISSARPKSNPVLELTPYAPEETESQRVVRVRVSSRTRRAAPRQLFSEEQGAAQTFLFTAECSAEDATALDEAALLVAAARYVRHLGRSRRRGEGECLFSLVGVSIGGAVQDPAPDLLQRFEEVWLKTGAGARPDVTRKVFESPAAPNVTQEHKVRLRLLARLDEPVIVASHASAGNRFESRSSISGRTLCGALARCTAQAYNLEDLTTYKVFRRVFLHDSVRFPTLYPLHSGYPVVPVPRDAGACKVHKDHPLRWGTQGYDEKCTCGKPLKLVRGGFYDLRELEPEQFKPAKRSEMHIEVNPATGRVVEGRLYDYVALEAGQYFAGELVCADESAWEDLQILTGLAEKKLYQVQLGKATQRGYGKVTLWVIRDDADAVPLWVQKPLAQRVKQGDTEMVLTLLTDTIVIDAWGRFAGGFENAWLSKELGLPVGIVGDQAFAGSRLVDGFNAQWRLPARRAVALEAGSTVRIRVAAPVDDVVLARLKEVETGGIGIRRNEGYGLVAFNHPIYDSCKGLSSTYIAIGGELVLAVELQRYLPSECRQTWTDRMDDILRSKIPTWNGQPFTALARWLQIHRYDAMADAVDGLQSLGDAKDALQRYINDQGKHGGEAEYDFREADDDLKEKGALKAAVDLLEILRDELPQEFWPEGIGMLADRLAEAAEKKGVGR